MDNSLLWMVLFGVIAGAAHQPSAEAVIVINEVLADPSGDANRDGGIHPTRDEFIELANTGPDGVSLANWTLSDLIQVRHTFAGSTLIPGGGFFVIFGGGSPQGFSHAAVASSGGLGLNNTGDTITLLDASAALVDVVTYGAEGGMDVSLTRSPDATGPFVSHAAVNGLPFSPGTTAGGLAQLSDPAGEPVIPEPPLIDPVPPFDDPTESDDQPAVPEPSSLALLGVGLCGLPWIRLGRSE